MIAGTVVTDSAIRVRVEAVGEDTALAGIQRQVAEAVAADLGINEVFAEVLPEDKAAWRWWATA